MMRTILALIPSLGCGGAEKSLTALANHLSAENDVIVATLSSASPYFDLDPSVRVTAIDASRRPASRLWRNLRRIRGLRMLIDEVDPEVILGYTIHGAVLASLAARHCDSAVIVCERSDPACYPLLDRLIRRFAYRFACAAVFQTEYARAYFGGAFALETVIPNFLVSSDLPSPAETSDITERVVAVGRLEEVKNFDLLIDAFSRLPTRFDHIRLVILGEGALRHHLEEKIERLHLTHRIEMPGATSDIPGAIRTAMLFVHTSRHEGFSNALLEAAAMQIPCIAVDTPTYSQRALLSRGRGVILSTFSPHTLSEAIADLLDSPEKRRSLSAHCTGVRDEYAAVTLLPRWDDFIEAVAMARRKDRR